MRSVRISACVLVFLLAIPGGSAAWRAYGTQEPDSTYDSSDFLWWSAPTDDDRRIYFNAFPSLHGKTPNPNVGVTGSRVEPVGSQHWYAMLGVWRDCNRDGYVGLAESAADEYREELLSAIAPDSPCAPDSPHRRGGWVTELRWIGPNRGGRQQLNNSRAIYDDASMVWGDYGFPYPTRAGVQDTAAATCPIHPLPRGTLRWTGAALNYVDCFDGHRLGATYNCILLGCEVEAIPIPTARIPGADEQDSLGLALMDPNDWSEQGHPVHQETFGSESSRGSAVRIFDCSNPSFAQSEVEPRIDPVVEKWFPAGPVYDAWDSTRPYLSVGPRPASPDVRTERFSVAGTVNESKEEVADDCNPRNDHGHDFYFLEGDHSPAILGEKAQADFNFEFENILRGRDGRAVIGRETGAAFGVTALNPILGSAVWDAHLNTVTLPGTVRTSDLLPVNASFFTFYATVGWAARMEGMLPSASVGTYGSLFCSFFGMGAGIQHGWECDGSRWYQNLETGGTQENADRYARPGQIYQLRDVDCFDGSLHREVPVGASLASISDMPCQARPLEANP